MIKYYFFHLFILIFSLVAVEFLAWPMSLFVFWLLSYIWHFTLCTPGAMENYFKSSKKFSFIRMVFKFHYALLVIFNFKKWNHLKPSLARSTSPILFALLLALLGGKIEWPSLLFGSLTFELFHHFSKKFVFKTL